MVYAYEKHVTIGMNLLDCMSDEEDRKKAKVNFDRALSGGFHSAGLFALPYFNGVVEAR